MFISRSSSLLSYSDLLSWCCLFAMAIVPRLRALRSTFGVGGTPEKPSRQLYPHSKSVVLRVRSAPPLMRLHRQMAATADMKNKMEVAMDRPQTALIS